MNLIRTPLAVVAAALLSMTAHAQPAPTSPDAVAPPPPLAGPAGPDRVRPPAPRAERGPDARRPRPRDDARRAATETTLTGRVARWLVNPNGDVDGLLLDDGTQVAFPPHLSASLTEAVKARDTVEVTGRSEVAQVVHAWSIKNTRSGQSVRNTPPDPRDAPPHLRQDGALTAMNASGRIGTLLYTGRGDVKGALLDDGTVVRFPPHAAAQMSTTLRPGAALYARGYGTRSPQGNAFEATAIGTTAENARELFAGPVPVGMAPPQGPLGAQPAPGSAPAQPPVPPAPRTPS